MIFLSFFWETSEGEGGRGQGKGEREENEKKTVRWWRNQLYRAKWEGPQV